MEAQLGRCPECAAEIASIRSLSRLLSRLPEIALPRSFVLTQAPAPARRPTYGLWSGSLATAAAAVLLVFLLVGDAVGLVTQSPTSFEESRTQQAIAPAVAELRSVARSASDATSAPAPAAPAPLATTPTPAAPAAPAAAAAAPAIALEQTGQAESPEASAGADASVEMAAAAPAPAAAMSIDEPTPELSLTPPAQSADQITPSFGIARSSSEPLAVPTPDSSVEVQGLAVAPLTGAADEEQAKADSGAGQSEEPGQSLRNDDSLDIPGAEAVESRLSRTDSSQVALPASDAPGDPEGRPIGISIPLRQLQIAMAVALVALLSTTILIYRRSHLP